MANGEIAQDSLIRVADNPGMAAGGGATPQVKPPSMTQKADIKPSPDPWADDLAIRVVLSDFARAERFRKTNFDERWTANDRILHANVAQEYWEGTEPRVPKASIGVKLEQQQLESLLPYLHEGIFASNDGIWFDFHPRPGTSPDAALASREFIATQTDVAGIEQVIDHGNRCMGHHGTQIIKVGWCKRPYDRAEWRPASVNGGMKLTRGPAQTGYVPGPEATVCSLRDIYLDPSLNIPDTQKAQFVIQRGLRGWDELQRMGAADKSYKIPSREEIRAYLVSRAEPTRAASDSDRQQSLSEAGQTTVHLQGTTDPARARLEVLEYWTLDRFVVVLERKWVICNKKNPYGFMPFFSCNYMDVIDQFYGKGLAEVLEYEQLLQQGLINSHLNEVSLNIHGAIAAQANMVTNKNSLRPAPGQTIFTVGKPSDVLMEIKRSAVTQDWFVALQQSQLRAQQYTGLSDIVTQGAPGVATSVTRTAKGVGALQTAAHSRIQFLIERLENRLVIPLLDAFVRLNKLFLNPNDQYQVVKDGQTFDLNPLAVVNSNFAIELRAGSKMAARQAMQATLPFMAQYAQAMIAPLAEQGWKFQPNAFWRDACEIMNWRSKSNDWFVPMSPQERAQQQQQQSLDQQKLALKKQLQDEKFQHQDEMMQQQTGLNILQDASKQALGGAPAAAQAMAAALNQAGAEDA